MANNLGSLVVSLGLDAAEFVRGLTKAEYQQQQWARKVETTIEAARTSALAGFAAIGTAVIALDRQLEGIAGFQDLADKIGDTAQEVASLKLAADVSGTSLDAVAAASIKLTAALAKTDDESKGAALGLQAIGLEVQAFEKLNPVAQIDAVAQALAGFEDGAGKTAAAVQIFGKSGADLIPILNDLAEQGGRQITLTQEQIGAADEYSKSTARLRSEVQTLVQVTAAEAAPAMQQIVGLLQETARYSASGSDGINLLAIALGTARTALEAILVIGSEVAFVFKTLGDTAGAYAAVSVALVKGDIEGARAIGAAYREVSAERRAALGQFQGQVLNPATFSADDQSAAESRRLGLTSAPRRINTAGFSGGSGGRSGGSAASAAQKTADEARRVQAQFEADQRSFADAENQYRLNLQEKRLAEQLANEKRYNDEAAELERATIDYGTDQYIKRLQRQQDEQDRIAEEAARSVADAQKKQADSLAAAFTGTFDKVFTEGLKLGDLLKKLAYDAINIQLLTPAAQSIGKNVAGAASSLFAGFFATGGYVPPGQWGIAGERGPEPIFGGRTGLTVQPNSSMGGGGGAVIHQSFNFGNADASTVAQLRAEASRIKAETLAAVPAAMVQAVRQSTGVARAMRGG